MLNDRLRAELERRLRVIAEERAGDPDARDLAGSDTGWLVTILILSCLAVPFLQASG